MRHGDKVNNLGRTASHRRALMANLAIALIEHKRITTTLAKAKALRQYVEPLVTKSKDNSTHSRRVVFSYLQNKEAIKELFGPIAERVGERPGGYVRVIKLGFRRGDGAETAMIEFVDFNETYNPNEGKTRVTKKTRRGGAPRKPGAETTEAAVTSTAAAVAAATEVEETPAIVDEPGVEEEMVMGEQEPAAEMEMSAEEPAAEVETADEAVAEGTEETPAEETSEENKNDEEQA